MRGRIHIHRNGTPMFMYIADKKRFWVPMDASQQLKFTEADRGKVANAIVRNDIAVLVELYSEGPYCKIPD
jgi:hypothetical protein